MKGCAIGVNFLPISTCLYPTFYRTQFPCLPKTIRQVPILCPQTSYLYFACSTHQLNNFEQRTAMHFFVILHTIPSTTAVSAVILPLEFSCHIPALQNSPIALLSIFKMGTTNYNNAFLQAFRDWDEYNTPPVVPAPPPMTAAAIMVSKS